MKIAPLDVYNELERERILLGDLVAALPSTKPGISELREHLDRIEIAPDPRQGELHLERAADRLRQLIRSSATAHASLSRISPLTNETFSLGDSSRLDYSYERSMTSTPLEQRVLSCAEGAGGRSRDAVVFSSGMAALSTVLELAIYEFFARTRRRPRVASMADYFETCMLIELQRASCEAVTVASSPSMLLETDADIVVLETLRYNWDLEVLPFAELSNAWRDGKDSPSVILIDSTLTAGAWSARSFLAQIAPETQVIDIRSGLKLDQQGLELSNLGIAIVHGPFTTAGSDDGFAELLRTARSVRGSGLPASAIATLEPSFLFQPSWSRQHTTRVAENNAAFAACTRVGNSLFNRISSPSPEASMSPFTVLTLEDDRLENYELLLGIIREEAERRKLLLQFGASFGFRGHRYETIIPAKRDLTCLFKVALGSRGGPTLRGTLELFAELATYSSIDELRRAYPNTRAEVLKM